jgi:hypothetical protein
MELVSPLFLAFGFRGIGLRRGGVHSGVTGILIREWADVPTCAKMIRRCIMLQLIGTYRICDRPFQHNFSQNWLRDMR